MDKQQLIERVGLVCLHTSPLAPLGGPDAGGMNLYVRHLAQGLSDLGIHADIFTRRVEAQTPTVVELGERSRVVHLRAGPVRRVAKRILPLYIPAMVQSMQEFTEGEHLQYDIWHSHYWISGLAALRIRHDPRVPVLHMFHTLARVKEQYAGRADVSDSVLRVDAERCLIPSVDAVVGATAGEEQLMMELYGRTPADYTVIPPGVDLNVFRPLDKRDSRARLGLDDAWTVVFVGRGDKIKRLDMLLETIAHLRQRTCRNIHLVVVGGHKGVRGSAPADYRQKISTLGLADVVTFRGIVPHDDLPYYYSAADVCAVPSAFESFGMVAIESMACQTPVAGFDVGGLHCTIKDGRTGFLAPPGNPPSLVEALMRALEHPDLPAVGRQARFSIRQHDWGTVVEHTLSLYERSHASRARLASRVSGNC
ncbi:MAG: glycosyltransferase [Chloroflexota bacterium]